MRVRFLGTGASGGTPGKGRSRRLESSLLVEAGLLIDATRDFPAQQDQLGGELDAALLTHAHGDACGGVAALGRWLREHFLGPVPLHASERTIAALERRFRRLERFQLRPVAERRPFRVGPATVTALAVPHAREARFPTFAWRLTVAGSTVVYASDVARLTSRLREFSRGANLLVIDGAMWGRRLFSHLTIDRELPRLCAWPVDRILLTQIGRTLPPHRTLERAVGRLCPRAAPAYDGLELGVGGGGRPG